MQGEHDNYSAHLCTRALLPFDNIRRAPFCALSEVFLADGGHYG
jgi:hypothetical protein